MAISLFLLRVLVLKVIGWLYGVDRVLPERERSRLKNLVVLYLFEHDSTVLIHVCLLVCWISCVICALSVLIFGFVGDLERSE